jgi:Zn-dependent protease
MDDELPKPVEAAASAASRPEQVPPPPFRAGQRPRRRRLPLILFLATCASTIFSGINLFPAPKTLIEPTTGEAVVDPATGKKIVASTIDSESGERVAVIDWRQTIFNGLAYATAVMVMLGAHEMGHYLQARRYHVPASLPIFIPMPISPIGTMGAVIVQKAGAGDRKAMFDIAISGPLAGLAIAIPLNWWGIAHSQIGPIEGSAQGWTNPLLVEWMIGWILRPLGPGEDIGLNPILFAGWVGFFITALNLVPIGQLDGGHILYCLLGKKAHLVARALYVGGIAFFAIQVLRGRIIEHLGWPLMLLLIGLMGTRHPPTANDHVPLGIPRIVLGWLTLAFIFVGFVASPMYQPGKAAPPRQPERAVDDRGLTYLENRLDFDRDISRQRPHADRAAGPLPRFAEHFHHQVAETVDDGRVILKIGGRVHHSQNLHEAHHAVERTEIVPQRREDCQSHDAGRLFALRLGKVGPDPAGDHRLIGLERAVAGDIDELFHLDARHIRGDGLGGGGKDELQFGNAGFSAHAAAPGRRVIVARNSTSIRFGRPVQRI